MILRSQLGRTYGNASSVGIRNSANYKYLSYDIGLYDSTRFMQDFGEGLDFTGHILFKPLENYKEKIGDFKLGTGYGIGEYYNSYNLYSFFLGYDIKKIHFKAEYANADGYNGVKCSRNKSDSFYTFIGYDITPKLTLLGRYDYLNQNKKISNENKLFHFIIFSSIKLTNSGFDWHNQRRYAIPLVTLVNFFGVIL